MGKKGNGDPNPASHCQNNFRDEKAISCVSYIISKNCNNSVITKLDSIDKWPNIDGYIELQENNILVGKVEVQVKTLPKENDYKFPCPVSFLAYIEKVSVNPVILLLVDTNEDYVYWCHLSDEYVRSLDYKNNKKSYTIPLDKDNYFDINKNDYIDKWINISNEYKSRVRNYNQLLAINSFLRNNQNEAVGISHSMFIKIHLFIDQVNEYMNTLFYNIKDVYYNKVWKIGVVICGLDENSLKYALYPISYDYNDVQIKFINRNTYLEVSKLGLPFHVHPYSNPLIEDSLKFAFDACIELIKSITKTKKLSLPSTDLLINEICFGIIDRYYVPFNLEKCDEYLVGDLFYSFFSYLPQWVSEAVEYIVQNKINEIKTNQDCLEKDALGNKYSFYDPYSLKTKIIDKDTIKKKAEDNILNKKRKLIVNNISSHIYPLDLYRELLLDLNKNQVEKIIRPYPAFNKCTNVYNSLSKEEIYYKAKMIFCNFPEIYNEFISINFPQYINELNYYSGFDIAIMKLSLKECYDEYEVPHATIVYLKATSNSENSFTILEDDIEEQSFDFNRDLIFNDITYRVCQKNDTNLNILFDDFPILELLYSILGERLVNIEPKAKEK